MPAIRNDKYQIGVIGDLHPVKIMNGDKVLIQAKEQTQTGTDLTFTDTYNDKVLAAKVKGDSVQKSAWWHKTGESAQDGTPAPDNPIAITSNLPAGTYRVQDYRGDWYEFTLPSDLHGIGDVRDSVEWDRIGHRGYLRTNNNKIVFDGVTQGRRLTSKNADGGDYKSFYITKSTVNWITGNADYQCMVSHFEGYSWGGSGVPEGNYWWYALTTTGMRLHKDYMPGYDDLTTDAQRIAAANAWLAIQYAAGTPVTVVYQLATPTRTPLTFTLNNASTAPELPMDFLTATPSVEYPAQIYDAKGSLTVRGKNLFDGIWENKVTNVDGSIVANPQFGLSGLIRVIPLAKVSFFGEGVEENNLALYDANQQYIGHKGTVISSSVNGYTVPHGIHFVRLRFKINGGFPLSTKAQLEQSPISTAYEPYRTPQTAPIPPIRSVPDGTHDEHNALTGVTDKLIGVKVFDGTEIGWVVHQSRENTTLFRISDYINNAGGNSFTQNNSLNTHFAVSAAVYTADIVGQTGSTNYNTLYLSVPNDIATTVAQLTAWLAAQHAGGMPMTIYYKLATPTTEQRGPVEFRTNFGTTIAETHNETPAEAEITATVRVFDRGI